jgi:hypothetical protein
MRSEEMPSQTTLSSPRPRKRRIFRWIFLGMVILILAWILISSGPFARAVRNLAGDKPDRIVLNNSFSISPRSFRYYKFSLPQDSRNVWLQGHIATTAENEKNNDSSIELFVLTETAFPIWQKGTSTGPVYDSGRISQTNPETKLPDGAAVYYLVLSNRGSSDPKKVEARLALHYKTWLPEWLRRQNPAQ